MDHRKVIEELSKIMADKIGHGMSEKCEVYARVAHEYYFRRAAPLPKCFGESVTDQQAAEYHCHDCPIVIDCRA